MVKRQLRQRAVMACLVVLACAGLAQALVFDDFNLSEGHFNLQPTFSGSTVGLATTSTADRVTSNGPKEGAGHERLVFVTSAATFRCRFLSASGSPGSNVTFTTSGATDGWIGYYVKTEATGLTASLWIEQASSNFASRKDIIADNEWHLYEWDLDDTSGGLDGWGDAANGIAGNSTTVSDGNHSIDSIIIRGTGQTFPATLSAVYVDYVARNPDGHVGALLEVPCAATPSVAGVLGPIKAGDTSVQVSGCMTTDISAVSVYADNTKIGTATTGFGAATVTVPLDAGVSLVKGTRLTATQTKLSTGQESCVPDAATGPMVGGGSNPKIGISFCIREDATMTGPVGAAGNTGSTIIHWIPAAGANGYSANGSVELQPGTCWQSVTATRGPDPAAPIDSTYCWYGTDSTPGLTGNFGTLDGIWFSMKDVDTGPYEIYVDELRNGSTVIQGWETAGQTQFFQPSYSGTPSSAALFLSGDANLLNLSAISSTYAYTGTHSMRVNWQWIMADGKEGLRLLAGNTAGGGVAYPQVDLRLPISAKFLILPVGGGTVSNPPTITTAPTDVVGICPGNPATLTAEGTVPAPDVIGYQWQKSTNYGGTFADIAGETGTTYTFTVAADESANRYRCRLTNTSATGCPAFVDTVDVQVVQAPVISAQPRAAHVCGTGTATFAVTAVPPGSLGLAYLWKQNGSPLSDGPGVSGSTTATLAVSAAGRENAVFTCDVSTTCSTPTTTTSEGAILTVQAPMTLTSSTSGSVALGTAVTLDVGAFTGIYYSTGIASTHPTIPQGAGVLSRIDPVVHFNWGTGTPSESPAVGTQSCTTATPPVCTWDDFMARWQTIVRAPADGNYTFYTSTDDGARLWVNGALVIDSWVTQSGAERTSLPVALLKDVPVSVTLEYFERSGAASARLYWSGPGLADRSDLSYVTWKKNGVTIPNATGARYGIASFATSNVGRYTAETVDPCTGSTLSFGPVELFVSADFNNSGKVDAQDVADFILCATNPDVPYVSPLTSPCVETMDQDGDGDIDTDDFGSVQAQFTP